MTIVLIKDRKKKSISKHAEYWFTWCSSDIWAVWHIRKREKHVPVPSVLATSSFISSFMSYLLPLVEVFLNLALFATRLCLFLPLHLSTCPSASPTSRSPPPVLRHEEMNGALSLARLFRGPALRMRKVPVINGRGDRGRMKNEFIYGQVLWAA